MEHGRYTIKYLLENGPRWLKIGMDMQEILQFRGCEERVVQIHGDREDMDRESMVRTFGYDTMLRF